MIIDWLEYEQKEHVLAWFLVEAMSEAGIDRFGSFDSSKLEVTLTVNGIEVPVTAPMEHLQSQLSDIKEKGKKHGRREMAIKLADMCGDLLEETWEEE